MNFTTTLPPFAIRDHVAWPNVTAYDKKGIKEFTDQGWVIVSTACKYAILERPADDINLKPAKAPAMAGAAGAKALLKNLETAEKTFADLKVKRNWPAIAQIINTGLASLAGAARRGDSEALYYAAQIGILAGEMLSEFARVNPAALRPVAHHSQRWPVMKSASPMSCDSDKIVLEVEAGKALNIFADKYTKSKHDVAANIAFDLLQYVRKLAEENPKFPLPKFSRDTAEKWWQFATVEFLNSYPEPEKFDLFTTIATTPSRKKSPGRMREQILSKIRSRFIALAPV